MNKIELIQKILDCEWLQFSSTNNMGQKADCQSQKGNFIVSRRAYWNMFNERVLNSYLSDQENAKKNNINLITYKYAYMIQYTDPKYFEKIKNALPIISNQKKDLINSILIIYMNWENNIQKENPTLDNANRKLYSINDNKDTTSVQTYMKGELSVYSLETLKEILLYFLISWQKNTNPVYNYLKELQVYENTSKNKENTNFNKQFILDLDKSLKLCELCKKNANEINIPIVVSVVDLASNLICMQRMNNSLLASIEISLLKAKTSVHFKIATNQMSNNDTLQKVKNNYSPIEQYCYLGGGVPLFIYNQLIGAVGISGGSEKQDILIAQQSVTEFFNLYK